MRLSFTKESAIIGYARSADLAKSKKITHKQKQCGYAKCEKCGKAAKKTPAQAKTYLLTNHAHYGKIKSSMCETSRICPTNKLYKHNLLNSLRKTSWSLLPRQKSTSQRTRGVAAPLARTQGCHTQHLSHFCDRNMITYLRRLVNNIYNMEFFWL